MHATVLRLVYPSLMMVMLLFPIVEWWRWWLVDGRFMKTNSLVLVACAVALLARDATDANELDEDRARERRGRERERELYRRREGEGEGESG